MFFVQEKYRGYANIYERLTRSIIFYLSLKFFKIADDGENKRAGGTQGQQ